MRPFMLRLRALGFTAYRSIYCKFKNLNTSTGVTVAYIHGKQYGLFDSVDNNG